MRRTASLALFLDVESEGMMLRTCALRFLVRRHRFSAPVAAACFCRFGTDFEALPRAIEFSVVFESRENDFKLTLLLLSRYSCCRHCEEFRKVAMEISGRVRKQLIEKCGEAWTASEKSRVATTDMSVV